MSFEPLPKDLEDSLLCLHELLTDESPTYGDVETWLPAFDELRKRGYLYEPSKLRMGGGGFFVLSNEGLRYFDRKLNGNSKRARRTMRDMQRKEATGSTTGSSRPFQAFQEYCSHYW